MTDATYTKVPNAAGAPCMGAHHNHAPATRATCDACGATVLVAHNSRRLIDDQWGESRYACWSKKTHVCDNATVEARLRDQIARYDAGELIKGWEAVVVRGRKIEHGTIGIVRWMGTNSWDVPSVGLEIDGHDGLVFTAASNLETVYDPEPREHDLYNGGR